MSVFHSLISSSVEKQSQEDVNESGEGRKPRWTAEDRKWLKETNKMLTLNYMVKYSPWKDEDMPGIYFPEPRLDHRPPIFEYGVVLTLPQIHEFAVKKGIIERVPGPDEITRGLHFDIEKYLNRKFGVESPVVFGMPGPRWIPSSVLLFSFSVWTNYKCFVPESKQSHVEEVMKSEFEVDSLTWYISHMNESLKSHYRVPESKILARMVR